MQFDATRFNVASLFAQTNNDPISDKDSPETAPVFVAVDAISIACIVLSLICTMIVIYSLYRKRIRDKEQEKERRSVLQVSQYVFQRLTHYCIVCLILTDLLFECVYLPASVLRAMFKSFDNMVRKPSGFALIFFSELAEWMFCASGIWSFFIAFCIYKSVQMSQIREVGIEDAEMYNKALWKKRYYKYGFAICAWVITGIMCCGWIYLNERYTVFPQTAKEYITVGWINDMTKTAIYVILEFVTVSVRIGIFCSVRKLHQETSLLTVSKKAEKQRAEEWRVAKQMTFFTLPFLICGTVLIIYRLTTDISNLVETTSNPNDPPHYNIAVQVLICIHTILFPLRGFLDALVYGLSSKWFRQNITLKCCKSKQRHDEDVEDEQTVQ